LFQGTQSDAPLVVIAIPFARGEAIAVDIKFGLEGRAGAVIV
jgi:hypothetical protein